MVLGRKRIEMKDFAAGRADLTSALLNGSAYAAIQYADIQRPGIQGATLAEGLAYYRLAYLMGDWKASRQMVLFQEEYKTGTGEMMYADERTMELYRNMLKYRGENHIPLRIWPRP